MQRQCEQLEGNDTICAHSRVMERINGNSKFKNLIQTILPLEPMLVNRIVYFIASLFALYLHHHHHSSSPSKGFHLFLFSFTYHLFIPPQSDQ